MMNSRGMPPPMGMHQHHGAGAGAGHMAGMPMGMPVRSPKCSVWEVETGDETLILRWVVFQGIRIFIQYVFVLFCWD